MSRRLRHRLVVVKQQCPECLVEFHPWRHYQVCCSRQCGAIRRARVHRHTSRMTAAFRANRAAYARRLGQRLAPMSKGEIWRLAYQRGYVAGWNKATRNKASRRAA